MFKNKELYIKLLTSSTRADKNTYIVMEFLSTHEKQYKRFKRVLNRRLKLLKSSVNLLSMSYPEVQKSQENANRSNTYIKINKSKEKNILN